MLEWQDISNYSKIILKTSNNQKKIAGSRDSRDIISSSVLSAPTSPVEQTPLKLSANIGRNPLRGSKCNCYSLETLSYILIFSPFLWLGFPSFYILHENFFFFNLFKVLLRFISFFYLIKKVYSPRNT